MTTASTPATRDERRAAAAERQRQRNADLAPVLPERMRWAALALWLALALGLAWLIQLPVWLSGEGMQHPLFLLLTTLMMFTPAVATLVTVLVFRPTSIPRLTGLAPLRPVRRTLGLSAVALVTLPVLAFLAMLLGHAMGLLELDLVGFSAARDVFAATGADLPDSAIPGIVAVQLAMMPVVVLLNCVATFGEEIGWRGWLLPNLLPLGTVPALVLSGAVWGLWHAPVILLGYNYQRTDLVGVLLMVGWCTLLGIVFGWLRLRSASVWPAVVAHAAVNASVNTLALLMASGQSLDAVYGTLLGWPGWILLAATVAALALSGQLTRRAQPGLSSSEAAHTLLPARESTVVPTMHPTGGAHMGLDDKIKNTAESVTGHAKEETGRHTGDRDLEAEGKGDQTKANLKQAGENIKDAFK